MATQTNPRQPIVYDMMLLADALLRLRDLFHLRQRDVRFVEREESLVVALTRIRNLAQFSGKRKRGLINIADPEFGGVENNSFMTSYFDRISRYVSHPSETRYMKQPRYPQPKARETIQCGIKLLRYLKPVLDAQKANMGRDASHWYGVFADAYIKLQKT